MNFSEKVRTLRKQKGLSQAELGKLIGVSARSVAAYETDGAYPRRMSTYELLAQALGTDVNDLRTENEAEPAESSVPCCKLQMEAIKSQTAALFAGGELSDSEELAFLMELNAIYLKARNEKRGL